MNIPNPEIESQLNELAELCCRTIKGDETDLTSRSDALLKSMVMSGFFREPQLNMRDQVESRAKEKCPEIAIHRGAELAGLTLQFQEKLEELLHWETKQPQKKSPPKSANIRSATDR